MKPILIILIIAIFLIPAILLLFKPKNANKSIVTQVTDDVDKLIAETSDPVNTQPPYKSDYFDF